MTTNRNPRCIFNESFKKQMVELHKCSDELLDVFQITRSLSRSGCPYDNAVTEATYRAFKVEFIYQQSFDSLFELQYELTDYVNWWNHFRKHGKLSYQSPINYRLDWKLK